MTEFLLCLFGGYFGLHKFYKKDWKMGLVYLITIGLFGLGWIYDILKIGITLIKDYTSTEEYKVKRAAKAQAKAEAKARAKEERELALKREQERIEQLEREGIVYCPRCKSTSVQYVERRKRLSVGRAVAGTVLLNPLWGAVGAVTSKKYKGFNKCLKCGHSWKI